MDTESRPPKSIQADPEALHIEWQDGVRHKLTWKFLRENCPCATCRDERQKSPVPTDSSLLPVISAEEARLLTVRSMTPVGNYAYGIDFTDGHTTGIYRLEYLRQLGEVAAAAGST